MKCPLCNTEAKIQKSQNIIKGDKLFRRMFYVCRDKNCANYEKEIGKVDVECEVTIEE